MRNYWKLILNSIWLSNALLLSLNNKVQAQLKAAPLENESYYIFPIKPGQQNSLAGTMGELRSSHFHSGIDIRTEGRTGLPVFAAAMGYISRVSVSSTGYGNTLYILHPNGETTVYAHLEKFNGPIADYVLKEQYRLEKFDVNLFPYQGKFIVKKGDTIAYSGNSGSSGGPHLHFDIRDKKQQPLNPLSYGFDEILDRTPPIAENIFVKALNKDARVEGVFGTKKYSLRRVGNNYVLDEPIRAMGTIGLMLEAHDKLDYSRFRCGINTLLVEINEQPSYEHRIEKFAFSEQREIYRHMSYEDLVENRDRLHKLYIDDGNKLRFYETNEKKGKIDVTADNEIPVTITMIDTYGNKSLVNLKIKGDSSAFPSSATINKFNSKVVDNTMVLSVPKNGEKNKVRINGSEQMLAYSSKNADHFLFDMRKELPTVAEVNNQFIPFTYKNMVMPDQQYNYYDDRLNIYFQKNALFDTLYLETQYKLDTVNNKEYWSIGQPTTPLRKSMKVTLKPTGNYDKDKVRAYGVNGNYESFQGGEWEGNNFSFWTRYFNKYTLSEDTQAPTIQPVKINSNDIRFIIKDDKSGLNEFNAYVNGEWVLMNYDYKRNIIWSEKLDKNKPFTGDVRLEVIDNVGNKQLFESTIK